MKLNYLLDLFRGYLIRGKKGFNEEIEAWEDTIEVITDNGLMKKINEVRSRIARSA